MDGISIGRGQGRVEDDTVVAAARGGDESAFAGLSERYRHELRVHCYRMLGSFDESEDLVQETFLRAWRARAGFEGRSTFRAWLYRIATNACLDFLERHPREPRPFRIPPAAEPGFPVEPPTEIPWLQPYPDQLLDRAAPGDAEPDAVVVDKETIELVFLVAIQHLPPKQRAAFILRDVLGWTAPETASALDTSVAAVKSALQRARAVVKEHLPERRVEWSASQNPTEAERDLLRRYVLAAERGDVAMMAEMLAEDVRITMPPHEMWYAGRDAFLAGFAVMVDPASPAYFGEWRSTATHANRMPAVAHYVRRPGDDTFRAQVLDVIRVEEGKVAQITAFVPELFAAFGLPPTL